MAFFFGGGDLHTHCMYMDLSILYFIFFFNLAMSSEFIGLLGVTDIYGGSMIFRVS